MVSIERVGLLGAELSPRDSARRALALDLLETGLRAVEPEAATVRALAGADLSRATVFAFGKAAAAMTRGAVALGARRGVVVARELESFGPGFDALVGGHPDPAADASETSARVLERARALGPGDLALCLVSGGGSAMLTQPAPGVSLEALRRVARQLRERGASIEELNAVRGALDAIKAGGLARALEPARVLNVILSDVPGHPLEVVGGGPTLPPRADGPDAAEVLLRYAVEAPPLRALEPVRGSIETRLAGDGRTAQRAIVEAARARGVQLEAPAEPFAGEARELAARLASGSWIAFGESTVTVTGGGRGGRNQELALAALPLVEGALVAALGTDGVDGSSDAAGALIDAGVAARAAELGLRVEEHLARNDSHTFFERVGSALRTGPTGTNVADLLLRLE